MLSAGAVILNYNSANDSIRLANILVNFKSIKKVIIVDNASTDNSRIQLNQVVNSKIKINGLIIIEALHNLVLATFEGF